MPGQPWRGGAAGAEAKLLQKEKQADLHLSGEKGNEINSFKFDDMMNLL